jgi:2,3-bisphosphoglycerate-dependent phosphoglycerate mutase
LRLEPFWKNYTKYIKESKGDHLIVAHSNSLRAIVKILDQLSDKEIVDVNIPTGVPLVYSFDNNFNVVEKKYLIDDSELEERKKSIENQGKASKI